jgi:cell division septal protein FtsQ
MVAKKQFIKKFIKALRQELEQGITEQEDTLGDMQRQAWDIIMEKGKHIRGHI